MVLFSFCPPLIIFSLIISILHTHIYFYFFISTSKFTPKYANLSFCNTTRRAFPANTMQNTLISSKITIYPFLTTNKKVASHPLRQPATILWWRNPQDLGPNATEKPTTLLHRQDELDERSFAPHQICPVL